MNTPTTVTTIANEALDQLQCAREYMRWFDSLSYAISDSLSYAISDSLKKGHDHHAAQLASIAQYLAGDYHNTLDCEVESLNEKLEALELRN